MLNSVVLISIYRRVQTPGLVAGLSVLSRTPRHASLRDQSTLGLAGKCRAYHVAHRLKHIPWPGGLDPTSSPATDVEAALLPGRPLGLSNEGRAQCRDSYCRRQGQPIIRKPIRCSVVFPE